MAEPTLILASASPRRLDLLRQIGCEPQHLIAASIDEAPLKNELPRIHAIRVAREKAEAVFEKPEVAALSGPFVILAADTVVGVGRRILPKAETEEDARACLALLSGRAHRVHTALALIGRDGQPRLRHVETKVGFKRLSKEEIETYIASKEWQGKAGGYAIQGLAAAYIDFISGSYSGVVGLPLYETAQLLGSFGIKAKRAP
ncbi:MAG: Maf family protein [Hyphomicrobiales bacterium]